MDAFKPFIAKVATGASLNREEARAAFDTMLSGEVTPAQGGGFLMALRVRGESVDEIAGAVEALRSRMLRVEAPADAVDIVGTGGDNSGSYNVSTLAAIITAAAGVPVAKHGNRAASSKSGAADVLVALGVNLSNDPANIARAVREAGVGFMFAPNHHASMRHVGPVRVELGTRTLFNIIGPLSNPAGARRQVLGTYSSSLLAPLAEVLRSLGSERVWLVHGLDGLDELSTAAPTDVVALEDGSIRRFTVTAEEAGLPQARPEDLRGGDPEHNAKALLAVLAGEKTPYRDISVLNAAAALVVAKKAANLREGAAIAAAALDSGKARATLDKLVAVSNDGSAA
ncbi:anthranilate phosphoribosyltransferase [Pseudochelatococcus lubricantis]|uniref:Anthranilate phosphoribosyltransferase n=1 Tax=Pseudochelatococcus lubricantis TaxID=1538102 RepID=A0ABX0V4W9_9HYPH|nr:anthranilate phosphoribosyltransferase [Pseudochelatococcus lubricantis]NIJ59549.1 anthranilate phosphoribosyltransferase [Pseudochelatococcus lubricantis]